LLYIDVGKANLIFNLNPLVVVLLSKCMLNENVTKWDYICSLGAFAGVVVVSDVSGKYSIEKEAIIGISLASISAILTGI